MQIGILSTGTYLPEEYVTGKQIAQLAGIPVQVIEEKMGIKKKYVPGRNDHTCEMGIIAERNIKSIQFGQLELNFSKKLGHLMPGHSMWH